MSVPDATALLLALGDGEGASANELAPLVYQELRQLAASHLRSERRGHTLQPTALANEAYIRLVDQTMVSWNGRAHFMAVAAEIIRRILVDHARSAAALKRGGGRERVTLSDIDAPGKDGAFDVLDLNAALTELEARSERQAKVVKLKFFGGLENGEIAAALGVSETLVKNEWRFARVWLATRLRDAKAT